MDFEGSMTPPLSDEDDWTSVSASDTSPILKLHKRQKTANGNTDISFGSHHNSDSYEIITEMFYEASIHLCKLEKHSKNPFFKNIMPGNQSIKSLLQKITESFERFSQGNNIDEMFYVIELFYALSSQASLVGTSGLSLLYQTSRSSDGTFTLHECGNDCLIEWFHCFCDINSMVLDICKIGINIPNISQVEVNHCSGFPVLEDGDFLVKFVSRVLHELAFISFKLFQQYLLQGNNDVPVWQHLVKQNPYPCHCFNDLLMKCRNILQEKNEFWNISTSIINSLVQNVKNADDEITSSCSILFDDITIALSCAWWWTKGMPLFNNALSCHNLINRLVRLSISHCMDDGDFAFHLICYRISIEKLRLSSSNHEWKPSELASFHLLWRIISQRLGNCMKTTQKSCSNGIERFTVKEISVQEWVSQCNKLQDLMNFSDNSPTDIFQLFLCIFDFMLQEDECEVWLQLKDRFFCRLQSTKMRNLTEIGFRQFFSILIVLLKSCPLHLINDVLTESMSVYELCIIERNDWRKRKSALSGMFALMHVCVERRTNFEIISSKVGKLFIQICKILSEKSLKSDDRFEVYKIFIDYLQTFTNLLQISGKFSYGQINLIPSKSLQIVLEEIGSTETTTIINFLAETLSCLRLCSKNKSSDDGEFDQLCWSIIDEVLHWFKKQVVEDAGEMLVDVALDLTLLCIKSETKFAELWVFLASEGQVDINFRCKYLNNVLGSKEVVFLLNNEIKKSHKKKNLFTDSVIQGWVKCSIILPSVEIMFLTSAISNLSVMKDFIDPENLFTYSRFLKSLAQNHRDSKNFLDKIRWSDLACRWFPSTVEFVIPSLRNAERLTRIYSMLGTTFEHCAPLLYIQGKPSFVSRIFENFILDPFNTSDVTTQALHSSLHKFILGAIAIGMKNYYISKILERITESYLTRWPCILTRGGITTMHPFVNILQQKNHQIVMINLLHDAIKSETKTEKLAAVVEMIHLWIEDKDEFVELPNLRPAMQQARVQLSFNKTLTEKVDIILKQFNNVADL